MTDNEIISTELKISDSEENNNIKEMQKKKQVILAFLNKRINPS